jgi:DNA-binding NarL/FixJ family response regulator
LLADDQAQVRFALRVLLEREPGLEVTGEAVDAEDLLAQVRLVCPDAVLLDWELPGLATAGGLSALHKSRPGLTVIALSGKPEACRAALQAGANAFVSKTDPPERLLAVIEQCCEQRDAESQRHEEV